MSLVMARRCAIAQKDSSGELVGSESGPEDMRNDTSADRRSLAVAEDTCGLLSLDTLSSRGDTVTSLLSNSFSCQRSFESQFTFNVSQSRCQRRLFPREKGKPSACVSMPEVDVFSFPISREMVKGHDACQRSSSSSRVTLKYAVVPDHYWRKSAMLCVPF